MELEFTKLLNQDSFILTTIPSFEEINPKVLSRAKEGKTIYISKGFAHGFIVLSKTAVFSYKCDNYYNKKAEGGIIFNDPSLNIDWEIDSNEMILSEKDLIHPKFGNHMKFKIEG